MAAKKSAVDRVIDQLIAEQAEIGKTIVRLEKARDVVLTRRPRKTKAAPATEGSAR